MSATWARTRAERMSRMERVALLVLGAFTAVSVVGYGLFGLHPERLPDHPLALAIFNGAFTGFARLHVLLSALVLFLVLTLRARARWIPGFVAVALAAFLSEHLGTGTGVPFGAYEYTGLLGPRVLDRVPALIPISWFTMALPAFLLAHGRFAGAESRAKRLAFATGLLVLWDLALDPAMSFLTPYWSWEASGAYYGMPAVNLLGWTAVGLLLMGILEVTRAASWGEGVPRRWLGAYYLLVLAMPLGMLVAAGLWLAVVTTLAALLVAAGILGLPASGSQEPALGRTRLPADGQPVEAS